MNVFRIDCRYLKNEWSAKRKTAVKVAFYVMGMHLINVNKLDIIEQ